VTALHADPGRRVDGQLAAVQRFAAYEPLPRRKLDEMVAEIRNRMPAARPNEMHHVAVVGNPVQPLLTLQLPT
jgi:hypothetical protein